MIVGENDGAEDAEDAGSGGEGGSCHGTSFPFLFGFSFLVCRGGSGRRGHAEADLQSALDLAHHVLAELAYRFTEAALVDGPYLLQQDNGILGQSALPCRGERA